MCWSALGPLCVVGLFTHQENSMGMVNEPTGVIAQWIGASAMDAMGANEYWATQNNQPRRPPWESDNLSFNEMLQLQAAQAMVAAKESERYIHSQMQSRQRGKSDAQRIQAQQMSNQALNKQLNNVLCAAQMETQKIPAKKPKDVLAEVLDALEYLIADVKGNVRRNPKLEGLDTNFAMRRAQAALRDAQDLYEGKPMR